MSFNIQETIVPWCTRVGGLVIAMRQEVCQALQVLTLHFKVEVVKNPCITATARHRARFSLKLVVKLTNLLPRTAIKSFVPICETNYAVMLQQNSEGKNSVVLVRKNVYTFIYSYFSERKLTSIDSVFHSINDGCLGTVIN